MSNARTCTNRCSSLLICFGSVAPKEEIRRFEAMGSRECADCSAWKWYIPSESGLSLHAQMMDEMEDVCRYSAGRDRDDSDERDNESDHSSQKQGGKKYVNIDLAPVYVVVNGDLVADVMKRQLKRYLAIWHRLVALWYESKAGEEPVDVQLLLLGFHWSNSIDHNTKDQHVIDKAISRLQDVSIMIYM